MNRLQYLALVAIVACGCGKSGPSYNEALQTYNAEIEVLDRLKEERQAILDKHDQDVARVAGLIKTAVDAGQLELSIASAADLPAKQEQFDRDKAKYAAQMEEFSQSAKRIRDADLAVVDKSIAEQRGRVQTAEKVKNEAEKNR